MFAFKRLLDFEKSATRFFFVIWFLMMVIYYPGLGWLGGKALAISSARYLCGRQMEIDESYAFPMMAAVVVTILIVIFFVKYGVFERRFPKTHTNGASNTAGAFLIAALSAFLGVAVLPCEAINSSVGVGRDAGGILVMGQKIFFIYSFLFSSLMTGVFYFSVISAKTYMGDKV